MNRTAINLLVLDALNEIALKRFRISRYEFLTPDARIRCWNIFKNDFHDQLSQIGILDPTPLPHPPICLSLVFQRQASEFVSMRLVERGLNLFLALFVCHL